jgi:hypothetical protein
MDSAAILETGGGGDGDVDGTVEGAQEAPEDDCGAVAENSALTASEHRRHPAAVETQTSMSHRINPPVHAMQLTPCHTISYRPCSQTSAFELPSRDRTMLPRRDRRHRGIGCVAFLTHVGT